MTTLVLYGLHFELLTSLVADPSSATVLNSFVLELFHAGPYFLGSRFSSELHQPPGTTVITHHIGVEGRLDRRPPKLTVPWIMGLKEIDISDAYVCYFFDHFQSS